MSITLDIPTCSEAEPRIPLAGVTWEQYETMIATVSDRLREGI
jgi:hypothetical protein